jgi:hypothetical protein
MIYISEAHASDEWKLGNIVDINQHKNVKERITAAKNFIEEYSWNIPTVVDGMAPSAISFEQEYSAWPERYYIIGADGTVQHRSDASNEYGFDRLGLKRSLRQFIPEEEQTGSLLSSNFDIFNDEAFCVHSDNIYQPEDDTFKFVPNQVDFF